MKSKIKLLIAAVALISTSAFSQTVITGKAIPSAKVKEMGELQLKNDKITYKEWDSNKLNGKVHIIQAIAGRTSSKEMNAAVIDTIKAAKFPESAYRTSTLVNLDDAIWGTSGFVKSSLEDSKKEYPHSSFILDKNGNVAKAWKLKPKSSAIILTDKNKVVHYFKQGKLSPADIKELMSKTKALIK